MPDRLPDFRPRSHGVYDLAAPLYDAVSAGLFFERALRDRAVRLLAAAPGQRVLDVGCGTGLCLSALSRELGPTGSVVGIDPSGASLDRARRRARRLGCDFTAIVADAATHPFAPASFDGAIAVFSLSVIPDFRQALGRVHAALKAGARFVVLEQRYPSRTGIVRRVGAVINTLLSADPERDFAGALQAAGFVVETHPWLGGFYEIYVAARVP
jgi:ubiquinone/menaquinone biosynthesis C-methylase UbiE